VRQKAPTVIVEVGRAIEGARLVAAVTAYARINSRGELIERTQTVNLNQLFNRMTKAELDNYAKTGALPDWFEETLSATGADNYGGRNGG
jgi:hypothetical protein